MGERLVLSSYFECPSAIYLEVALSLTVFHRVLYRKLADCEAFPDRSYLDVRRQGTQHIGVMKINLVRLLHLGDGADDAVDAERAQGAAEVEAGDSRLVDAPGRLEAERPLRDRGRVVAERGALALSGHGVQGEGLDAAGVDVEADRCDII